MSEQKYVTLKDLAKECGVTPTTVSLALRNHPRISDATKENVRKAAKKLAVISEIIDARIYSLLTGSTQDTMVGADVIGDRQIASRSSICIRQCQIK